MRGEFGAWEDYGLSGEMERFLAAVPAEHRGLAIRIFEQTTAELAINGLGYEHCKTLSMWAAFLVAHGRFEDFKRLAHRARANVWRPIVTMAEAAWKSGRKEIARAVFAAANRPGPDRDRLRVSCRQITGEEAGPCPPIGYTCGAASSG